MKINSHNEWDKLLEVIVGSAEGISATLEWMSPEPIPPKVIDKARILAQKASPKWFVDEIKEDLDNLSNTIKSFGVKVYRPTSHDISKLYSSPFWSATGNNLYNVRDLHLIVGNTVIESPSHNTSRYFEATALYDIWYKYFDEGFVWIAGPKPKINKQVVKPCFRNKSERVLTDEDKRHKELTGGRLEKLHKLSEDEILFEAANTVRMGRDLLYLASSSGNIKGAKWLQSVVGSEYKVHISDKLYRASHIDSTVLCLRPGLVLLNSKRVTKETLPKIFDKWDKIWFDDVAPTLESELNFQNKVRDPLSIELKKLGFSSNLEGMSSPWVGMNFLSIDQNTVLVDERQKNLIKVLEKNKFTTVPVKLRHMYTQGGGIHCATLDTVRDSKLESYF